MVNIGNLTAVELWVGSVKANFAFIGDKQVWGGGGASVHYIDYINTNVAEMVTDYTPNSNTWVEGRFRGKALGNIFVGTTDTKWRFFSAGDGDNTFYVDVNGMSRRISQGGWNTTEWYDITAGNCYFTCVPDSGTTLSQTSSAASTTYSTPFVLGSSTYTWGGEYEEFDCAGFKVWEGNTLMRDYRPAKDANGVVCMYEEVSGTYCYPTNTGGVFLGYETIKTKVRYTAASGLPAWEGDIVGQIVGSSGQATTQIPNISSATSIEIGSKVTGIGDYAFYNCSNLSSMTMTDAIRTIGSYAFDTCTGLNEITMSNGLTSIASTSFDNCSNLSILNWTGKTISDAYNVRDYPWGLANGTTIHCSNGDLIVGQSPVTAGWTNVKYTTASGLSDRDYDIVGELGSGSVPNKSSSEEVEIGTHVTRIGSYAFQSCYSLASVTIPSSVTTIVDYAFNYCTGLLKLDCSACSQIPFLYGTALWNTNQNLKIIVPNVLYNQWKSATNWSTYADQIVMAGPSMSFKATQANSTVQLTQVGNPTSVSLEYMTTGSWTPYTIGDTITLANVGDEVFIRATSGVNNKFGTDASNYHQFVMTGEIEANYSINYLLNQNGSDSTLADNSYLFYKLFSGCSALTKAPELPVATMDEACYAYMFQGTSIEDMPKMPVATLDVDCYKGMFQDNTTLTTVELKDSTLANGCYDAMFKGCSSLAKITIAYLGNFSTTYFNDWVYGVAASGTFYYNGSDTTTGSSAIPTGWTSLPITRTELCFTAREANSTVSMAKSSFSAPTVSLEYCTDGVTWSPFVVGTTTVTLANVDDKMWVRATSTNKAMASSYNSNFNYFVMTGQIAASGNINSLLNGPDPDAVTTAPMYAYPNLFQGCSALVDAIDLMLPSTTASQNSYGHGMFRNCTNLVGGPTIMATNLLTVSWTAENMFNGCSSLASVKIYATGSTWDSSNTQNWMYGVPATGTFYYNGTYTGRGASYIPEGWTITPFTNGGI